MLSSLDLSSAPKALVVDLLAIAVVILGCVPNFRVCTHRDDYDPSGSISFRKAWIMAELF